VLVLPIPFANLAPALALGAFSDRLDERRTACSLLAGYAFIAVAAGVVVLGAHGVALGLNYLASWFEPQPMTRTPTASSVPKGQGLGV